MTNHIYQVVQTERSVALNVVAVQPPRHKDYHLADEVDDLPTYDHVLVAERDERVVGVAALKLEAWNRRAIIWHFYVAPEARGHGVGRRLMARVVEVAQAGAMRCVWLETQNINHGAIKFYERVGFQWCGLDTSLYDGGQAASDEVALFFARHLDQELG